MSLHRCAKIGLTGTSVGHRVSWDMVMGVGWGVAMGWNLGVAA